MNSPKRYENPKKPLYQNKEESWKLQEIIHIVAQMKNDHTWCLNKMKFEFHQNEMIYDSQVHHFCFNNPFEQCTLGKSKHEKWLHN